MWETRIRELSPYQVNRKVMENAGPQAIFTHCLPAFHDLKTTIGKQIAQKFGITEMECTDEVFNGLNFLANQNMSVVIRKAMEGTILAHTDGGVPEVLIEVDDLSAYNVGYLIYFFWRACAWMRKN